MEVVTPLQIRQYNDYEILAFFNAHEVKYSLTGDHLFVIHGEKRRPPRQVPATGSCAARTARSLSSAASTRCTRSGRSSSPRARTREARCGRPELLPGPAADALEDRVSLGERESPAGFGGAPGHR